MLPDSKAIPGWLRRDGTLTAGWPKVSRALRLKAGDVVQLRAEACGSSCFHVCRLAGGQRPMRPTGAQREAIAEAEAAETAAVAAAAGQDEGATMQPTAAHREAIAKAEAAEAAAAGQDAAATTERTTAASVHPMSGAGFTVPLSKRYTGRSLSIPPSRHPAFAPIKANLQGSRWLTMVLPGGQEVRCSYSIALGRVQTGWPNVSAALGLQPLDELHICQQQSGGSRFLINKGLAGAATGGSPPVGTAAAGPALLHQLQSPATAALTGAAVEASSSPCTSPELQEPQQPRNLELIPLGAASVDAAQLRLPRAVLLTRKLVASDSGKAVRLALLWCSQCGKACNLAAATCLPSLTCGCVLWSNNMSACFESQGRIRLSKLETEAVLPMMQSADALPLVSFRLPTAVFACSLMLAS